MKKKPYRDDDSIYSPNAPIPLTYQERVAAYRSNEPDVRLLGEYWDLVLRIRSLSRLLTLTPDERKARGLRLSPVPLMVMQIRAMKKYANALAIRLDYEQGGRDNPAVIARIKAALPKGEPAIVLTPEAEKNLEKILEDE